MINVTFITGNQGKADFLSNFLEFPVKHQKLELDELQSLDLREIVEHKARQAYSQLQTPVLVEDVGLTLDGLGRLPGPFIKWFIEELGLDGICDFVSKLNNDKAATNVCFAYFDGRKIHYFDGSVAGRIAKAPKGEGGFGYDRIFIPDGWGKTHAEMDGDEIKKSGLRTSTVFPQIKEFLISLDKK